MALSTLQKQSYEERVFSFDFSGKMASDATISSVVSIVPTIEGYVTGSTNVTVGSITTVGQTVQALYRAGTSGELYKITAKIVDSNSQRLEMDGFLRVQDE
jgi:hypothetical protein